MLISSIKISNFRRLLSILPNKTQNIVYIFLKTNPKVCIPSNLFQDAFGIKIKKIQVTNMVSIKRNNHIIHWNYLPVFSKYLINKKVNRTTKWSLKLLGNTYQRNTHKKKKKKKKKKQDTSQFVINISSSSIFFQDFHGFSKKTERNDNIQWLTVNG